MACRRTLTAVLAVLLCAVASRAMDRLLTLGAPRDGYQTWYLNRDARDKALAPGCAGWRFHSSGRGSFAKTKIVARAYWSPSVGQLRQQEGTVGGPNLSNLVYTPGANEPIRLEVVWRVNAEEHKTVTELPRLPLPMGFRARAGADRVTLFWDPIESLPDHWVKGPEFVVLRLDSSQFRFGYVKSGGKRRCLLPTEEPKEIHACDSSVLTWTDRDVEPGRTYVYGLLVRGTMKVVTDYGDTDRAVTPVSMEVAAPPHRWDKDELFLTDWRCTRVATPGPSRPVRLAVFHSEKYEPALDVNVQQLRTALGCCKDMDIVERGIASTLLTEQDLGAMGGTGIRPVAAADLLLEVRLRSTAHAVFRDAWLHDFLNADSRRVASAAAGNAVGKDELLAVKKAVRAAFPNLAPRPALATKDEATKAVAVAPLASLGGTGNLDAEGLSDLLTAALQEAGAQVVDRERLQAASRELAVGATAEQAMALGRLVGAGFFVTGEWSMLGEAECRGHFRLVRTGDGLQVAGCEVAAADPSELAAAVARQFAAATGDGGAARPVGVMHRLLEARALYRARDERKWRDRARQWWVREQPQDKQAGALTAPEDGASLAQTARFYLSRNQSDRAIDFLRNRLAKVGKTGSFWEAAEPLAGILRERGESRSEQLLWQDLLAKTDPADPNYGCMALLLAETLVAQGQKTEALAWLAKVVPPAKELARYDYRMYRKGRLLEQLGLYGEAAQAYADDWQTVDRSRPTASALYRSWRPSLGAMVRLLNETDKPEARSIALAQIVCWHRVPQQAAKAAAALVAEGATDRQALWTSCIALALVDENDLAKKAAIRLLTDGTGTVGDRYRSGFPLSRSRLRWRIRPLVAALQEAVLSGKRTDVEAANELVEKAFRAAIATDRPPSRASEKPGPQEFRFASQITMALRRAGPEGNVFSIGMTRLWALQADGSRLGKVVWHQDLPCIRDMGLSPNTVYTEQDVHDGLLVVTFEGGGEVRGIAADSGKTKWRHIAWTPVSRPLVHERKVYVCTLTRDLLVLDLKTGRLIQRVPHPVEAEVFRPMIAPVLLAADGRSLEVAGARWLRYDLGETISVHTANRPTRTDSRPNLLDVFCRKEKAGREAETLSEADRLLAAMADRTKPDRERHGAFRQMSKRKEELLGTEHLRQIQAIALDQEEPMSIRRSALGLLMGRPGNPAACVAMSMIDDDCDLARPCLRVMELESDAAWVAAVKKVQAMPIIRWNQKQTLDKEIREKNLARTAKTGFLAPEIGWDQAAVDQAIEESLAMLGRFPSHQQAMWYEVANRTNSKYYPQVRDIVYGQAGGKRTAPIPVESTSSWDGTDLEAVGLARCMVNTHPEPKHIALLDALLKAAEGKREWGYREAEKLAMQQLARIATTESLALVFAHDEPFGDYEENVDCGMDLLEEACGRSFRTQTEWRLWWRRARKNPSGAK